ncbi:MAG: TatD family hydrolase [Clostridia bacterium]|jgi:TatD DNase family protein
MGKKSYPSVALGLTDTHAHLGYVAERLGEAALDAIDEAYRASGAMILDPGVDYDDFPRRQSAFGKLPYVWLAAGIWPDADSMKEVETRISFLEEQVRLPGCVAVGECGLDYHWMNGTEQEQANLFTAQLELALRYSKPLLVHTREAHAATLALVKDAAGKIPVVIHCFGYDVDEAKAYLKAGCYLSFAGNITYKNADGLRRACLETPVSRLLLETDAPYMCPEPRRGRQSSPLDIGHTYDFVASLRRTDSAALAETVSLNARELFATTTGLRTIV